MAATSDGPRASYDVVVIGAGVMGVSIAYHLALARVGRTLVLERDRICGGNTRKSGALVRMHYTNEPEVRMARASLDYFHQWPDLVGGPGEPGFVKTGFCLLTGPENADRLRQNVAMLGRLGVNNRLVDSDDVRELLPGLGAYDGQVAAYEPDSGYADPIATTYAFADRARSLGVEIRESVSVTGIRVAGDRVAGVETTVGAISSGVVVCAANVWTPQLLGPLGVDLGLWAHRAQTAVFHRPALLKRGHPAVIDLALGWYGRPNGMAESLAGLSAWHGPEPADPDRYNEDNDPGFPDAARARVAQRLPAYSRVAYLRGQAGLYDMSPDTRPILDAVPGLLGLFMVAGFSGTGFKISPAVGRCLAELISHGRAEFVDISPFRFTRFGEGKPIIGTHEYSLATEWGHRF